MAKQTLQTLQTLQMLKTFHGTVEGRVQGVFFRDSMKKFADQQGIRGWVKNTADGRVEWLICAEASQLKVMLDWLHEGPRAAKVSVVNYQEVAIQEASASALIGFEIRR